MIWGLFIPWWLRPWTLLVAFGSPGWSMWLGAVHGTHKLGPGTETAHIPPHVCDCAKLTLHRWWLISRPLCYLDTPWPPNYGQIFHIAQGPSIRNLYWTNLWFSVITVLADILALLAMHRNKPILFTYLALLGAWSSASTMMKKNFILYIYGTGIVFTHCWLSVQWGHQPGISLHKQMVIWNTDDWIICVYYENEPENS